RINAVTRRFRNPGPFAEMVTALRSERVARGHTGFDWVVATNRVRHCAHRLIAAMEANLSTLARHLGFRTLQGLTEPIAYRELLAFGLNQFGLNMIPELGAARATSLRELEQMVEVLRVPCFSPRGSFPVAARLNAAVTDRTARNFR